MKERLFSFVIDIHRTRIAEPVQSLLRDDAISGKFILAAVGLALLAANTPIAPWYDALVHANLSVGVGDIGIAMSLQHWVSEGLMLFFFLVVGLELKRELVRGQLRHKKTAILPFAAAVGGMILPAIIYILCNIGQPTVKGWAIPTATDIALAVGVLALLGNRIPSSIRIFLLALAIVDDLIAVLVITLFYSVGFNVLILVAMVVVSVLIYFLGKQRLLPMWGFVLSGVVLWVLALHSGVHASIIGALLGFLAPMTSYRNPGEQIAEKAERAIIPFSTLFVVPLFALVNTGISLDITRIRSDDALHVSGGIILGLVVGKALGIFGMSWLMVRAKLAHLPNRANWTHIAGIAALSGIGFTVAIFVTDLAFVDETTIVTAKLAIFVASIIAAAIGFIILRRTK